MVNLKEKFQQYCEQHNLRKDDQDLKSKLEQFCEEQDLNEEDRRFIREWASEPPCHLNDIEYMLIKDKIMMQTHDKDFGYAGMPFEGIINTTIYYALKRHKSELKFEPVGRMEEMDFHHPYIYVYRGLRARFEYLGSTNLDGSRTIPIRFRGIPYNTHVVIENKPTERISLRFERLTT